MHKIIEESKKENIKKGSTIEHLPYRTSILNSMRRESKENDPKEIENYFEENTQNFSKISLCFFLIRKMVSKYTLHLSPPDPTLSSPCEWILGSIGSASFDTKFAFLVLA